MSKPVHRGDKALMVIANINMFIKLLQLSKWSIERDTQPHTERSGDYRAEKQP